jgi:hypothetical protein
MAIIVHPETALSELLMTEVTVIIKVSSNEQTVITIRNNIPPHVSECVRTSRNHRL